MHDFAKTGYNEEPEKNSDTSTDVSDNEVETANTESASIITKATNLPGDITQSKVQSPVQPILSSYPQTVFGKGENARDRRFNHYWYYYFLYLLNTQLLGMLCFAFLADSSPIQLHLLSKCL